MIRLLIDSGNTNIKFAVTDEANWLVTASTPVNQDIDFSFTENFNIEQVWVSNVAGSHAAQRISLACARRHWPLQFITSQAQQCGVINGYERPDQLGSDRWAALLAARHKLGCACLVVCSGTATTIDALSEKGQFMGGLILPGIEMMRHSLLTGTAGLKSDKGNYSIFPRNTSDAMMSGALQSTCGAIQLQHAQLGIRDAPVILSGGAACLISNYLCIPVQILDNLVLQGLLLIARDKA
jgi:type III pantothenate kinase